MVEKKIFWSKNGGHTPYLFLHVRFQNSCKKVGSGLYGTYTEKMEIMDICHQNVINKRAHIEHDMKQVLQITQNKWVRVRLKTSENPPHPIGYFFLSERAEISNF